MPVASGLLPRIYRLSRWCALFFLLTIFAASLCGFQQAGLLITSKSESDVHSSNRTSTASTDAGVMMRRTKLHYRRLLDFVDRVGDGCTISDVSILQGEANPLPDGIPTFTVQVFNSCSTKGRCRLSEIHVGCGWWATAKLVNPSVFRRLGFNDCLVNDGRPLKPGQLLTFQYANSFQYPMSVKSVSVSCT